MPAPLSFLIELFDRMSAPASKISGSVDKLSDSLEKAHERVGGFESRWTKLNEKLELGKKGFEIVKGVAEGAIGILEKIGENQATQGIFEDILGKDEGAGVLAWLGKIRTSTAFTRDQLEGLAQPLAEFFKGEQLRRVMVAGLDVGRGNIGRTGEALDTFAKVASTGKISSRAFKTLGLTGPDFKKLGAGAAGEASITVERLLSMIAAKSGGQLGGRALQSSETVAAKLNHLLNWQGELWEKLSDSPALPKFTAALGTLGDVLTSPKVIDGIASVIEKMAAGFPEFLEQLGKFVKDTDWTAVAEGLKKVIDVIATLGGVAVKIVGGGDASKRVAGIGSYDDALTRAGHGSLYKFLFAHTGRGDEEVMRIRAQEIGESMADGVRKGMVGQSGAVADAAAGLGDSAIGGISDKMQIHSPSRVMQQLGGYAAEGFALGLEGKQGRIDGALSTAVDVGSAASSSSGRGRGSLSITFGDIIVQGGGKDARGIGEELRQVLRDTVRDLLDEHNIEDGLVA